MGILTVCICCVFPEDCVLCFLFYFSLVMLFPLTGRLSTAWRRTMDFKSVKEYFAWLYYQYQIISCCAVLEPWEQSMFNTILLTIVAMVVYTAYVFIPIHIRLAWEFFSKICGYHSSVSNWPHRNPVKWHDVSMLLTTCWLGDRVVFPLWPDQHSFYALASCLESELGALPVAFVQAALCVSDDRKCHDLTLYPTFAQNSIPWL